MKQEKLQLCRIILLKEYTYNIFDFTSLLFIMKIPLFWCSSWTKMTNPDLSLMREKLQLYVVLLYVLPFNVYFLSFKWNFNLLQPKAIVARYIHFFWNPYLKLFHRSERVWWEKEQIQISSGLRAQFSLVY